VRNANHATSIMEKGREKTSTFCIVCVIIQIYTRSRAYRAGIYLRTKRRVSWKKAGKKQFCSIFCTVCVMIQIYTRSRAYRAGIYLRTKRRVSWKKAGKKQFCSTFCTVCVIIYTRSRAYRAGIYQYSAGSRVESITSAMFLVRLT
jgi:hypothetical protein